MKIGYKDFNIDLSFNELKVLEHKIMEILNMNLPLWILIVIVLVMYYALWKHTIWKVERLNWELQAKNSMDIIRGNLRDITERFFTSQNLNKDQKESLLKNVERQEVFPTDWDFQCHDFYTRPNFFKPLKWLFRI